MQLAEQYPGYAEALVEKGRSQQIRIEVEQFVGQGQTIGVKINRLDMSGISPEDIFNRIVCEPLKALLHGTFDQQIIILVDALDEALYYSGNVNIGSLLANIDNLLPTSVRILLTSRKDKRVKNLFPKAKELLLTANNFEPYNQEDINRYVNHRLSNNQRLAGKIAEMEPTQVAKIADSITRKSEGNFLYTWFLLEELARDPITLTEPRDLPEGLGSLYYNMLQYVVRQGNDDWSRNYAPVLGILSIAQEPLSFVQLQTFTELPSISLLHCLADLQQILREEVRQGNKGVTYRLYHTSIIDFLHHEKLGYYTEKQSNPFYLAPDEWHRCIVNSYLKKLGISQPVFSNP